MKANIASLTVLAFLWVQWGLSAQTNQEETREWDLQRSWIVSPKQAAALRSKGALLLDARAVHLRLSTRLPDSIPLAWEDLSLTEEPNAGKLKPQNLAVDFLKGKGIQTKHTLLVLGDPLAGWGEEGRLVWSLRTFGYSNAFLVDGGVRFFLKWAERKEEKLNQTKPSLSSANFVPVQESIEAAELQKSIQQKTNHYFVLDVREKREYLGDTPYGERRGGHIPGAQWLYYKSFLNAKGFIKPDSEIKDLLYRLGYKKGQEVVSYCTGGVRSGFSTAVLVSYGYKAKNYAGSMWEWSAKPESDYPLVIDK
ncbi:rhodanese-like protein [Leptospira ryugenii]|uniref:Rhodanese-like protein n=1 Tax=Leptospira ryugenii TaxID=1917863 RepID=A0A2P2E1B0_9LEPT|nr:rhodanese-like domain-containing protein [Leptospira ryugenii]GBF50677.1 rhodanese-like protein [Leptospira ryugenii]